MEPITQKKKLLMALGGILLTGCLIFGIYSTFSSTSSSSIASAEAHDGSSEGEPHPGAAFKPMSPGGTGNNSLKSTPSRQRSGKSSETPTVTTATAATTATLVPTSQSSGGTSKPMSSDGTGLRSASSPLKTPSESNVTAISDPHPASPSLNGSLSTAPASSSSTGSVIHTDVSRTLSPSFETGRYGYMVITNQKSYQNFEDYRNELINSPSIAGASLSRKMQITTINGMTTDNFINLMLSTKIPKIFAEDYRPNNPTTWPWTVKEVELLGDVNIAMPVKIYDHGEHSYHPTPHSTAIEGYLLFTPGVLLVEACEADYRHIVKEDGLDFDAYYETYVRRLLPLLKFASDEAGAKGTKAVVTVPGIGCGLFSGIFKSMVNARFGEVLERILNEHWEKLPNISLVYFYQFLSTHFKAYPSGQIPINGIDYLVSSNITNPNSKILLESPASFGDKYKDHILFAFVAWDHLSFPGNDYFVGERQTDDGVKAAATSSMTSLLKFPGNYVKPMYMFDSNSKPSVSDKDFSDCINWGQISNKLGYELNINDGGLNVLQDGQLEEHRPIGRKFTFEEL